MTATHKPPSVQETAFNCPHCGVLTTQDWLSLWGEYLTEERRTPYESDFYTRQKPVDGIPSFSTDEQKMLVRGIRNIHVSVCFNCKQFSLWVYKNLVYPSTGEVPHPDPGLSDEIRRDYEEASAILARSPRGAAALIRLAMQKLCVKLGQSGKNLNKDIGALVEEGLPPRIQKALDVVRVIGNEAVHPGQIDLRDDHASAMTLFALLNMVSDTMITQPKALDDIYDSLPKNKRDEINKRDARDDPDGSEHSSK